jgi:hypothetical protein
MSIEKENEVNEDHVVMMLRGERPDGMDYEEFRIKRKALQNFLKRYMKGKLIKDETV